MKKVLIVEDNEDISAILKKRLEDNNFSVDILDSGYALLGHLRNSREPDGVILDLILPGRNGMELLYGLKSKWRETKVFIFSAHSQYKEKDYFEDYICGFFCKSEGMTKLIDAIKKGIILFGQENFIKFIGYLQK